MNVCVYVDVCLCMREIEREEEREEEEGVTITYHAGKHTSQGPNVQAVIIIL